MNGLPGFALLLVKEKGFCFFCLFIFDNVFVCFFFTFSCNKKSKEKKFSKMQFSEKAGKTKRRTIKSIKEIKKTFFLT
jgi:hypothetical protein